MVAVTLLVMTAAFGLNFAAGVFFAPALGLLLVLCLPVPTHSRRNP